MESVYIVIAACAAAVAVVTVFLLRDRITKAKFRASLDKREIGGEFEAEDTASKGVPAQPPMPEKGVHDVTAKRRSSVDVEGTEEALVKGVTSVGESEVNIKISRSQQPGGDS